MLAARNIGFELAPGLMVGAEFNGFFDKICDGRGDILIQFHHPKHGVCMPPAHEFSRECDNRLSQFKRL